MAEKTIPDSHVPVERDDAPPATRELTRYLVPAVDIFETEKGLTMVADLPGVTKEGLDIRVEDKMLTIVGRVSHREPADTTFGEFELFDYFRQFRLSDEVDESKISAGLTHGVLTMELPKSERAMPRKIDVKMS